MNNLSRLVSLMNYCYASFKFYILVGFRITSVTKHRQFDPLIAPIVWLNFWYAQHGLLTFIAIQSSGWLCNPDLIINAKWSAIYSALPPRPSRPVISELLKLAIHSKAIKLMCSKDCFGKVQVLYYHLQASNFYVTCSAAESSRSMWESWGHFEQ